MAQIKVETTVNRQYESESESVEVFGKDQKDVVLTREIKDVEEMVEDINSSMVDRRIETVEERKQKMRKKLEDW